MAYTKPKYEGNDFLEWYKSNFGVDYTGGGLSRQQGMSDIDWDIGNELYSAYQQQQARKEQYDSDYQSLQVNQSNIGQHLPMRAFYKRLLIEVERSLMWAK